MPASQKARKLAQLSGQCDLERASFAVAISDISCDGCSAEAECDWGEDCEFVHLRINDSIDVNGRVLRHDGKRADIRFYGQIHPAVIDQLAEA